MNLPNKLTLLRIAMVPIFVACFYITSRYQQYIAAAVFIIAFITDMLDGYIARKYNLVTDFGKFMDPIADKLLMVSALILLTWTGKLSPVITIIIICREFIVSGIRLVIASDGKVIAASWLGKAKTITQFIAVVLLILNNPIFSLIRFPMDQVFVYISLAFTLWSGADYVLKNMKNINFK